VGAGSLYIVEELALAVGEKIGHGSVKSAARINGAVVLFVDMVEQANRLVETGISVGRRFEAVRPLTQPSTRVTLSNTPPPPPPFISDEFLARELARRQVYMILNNRAEELNVRFHVKVEDFDYMLYVSSSIMKCFGCVKAVEASQRDGEFRRAGGWGPAPDRPGAGSPGGPEGDRATGPEESTGRSGQEEAGKKVVKVVRDRWVKVVRDRWVKVVRDRWVKVVRDRWSFVQTDSLHWLLKEPLVCGDRLDVCSSAIPVLKEALIRRKMVTLEQLVVAAGPELTDAQAVSSVLGVRSVRLIQRSLGLWKHRLSTKEKGLLLLHGRGEAETDPTDAFPELHLHTDLLDLGGPLLDGCGSGSLHSMDRRILNSNIVKALIKRKLENREVWKSMEGLAGGAESSVEDPLQAPHQEEDW
ncbi:hypothetical protein D4764_05G0010400, partial [Takifugu flavidus]